MFFHRFPKKTVFVNERQCRKIGGSTVLFVIVKPPVWQKSAAINHLSPLDACQIFQDTHRLIRILINYKIFLKVLPTPNGLLDLMIDFSVRFFI